MKDYLSKTSYSTYKYQRRVPKILKDYVNTHNIRVTLGKNKEVATTNAIEFNKAIDKAIQLVKLNAPQQVIQQALTCIIGTTTPDNATGLKLIIDDYMKSQAGTISDNELRAKQDFYINIMLPTLGSSKSIDTIRYSELLNLKDILTKLPKRSKQVYKSIPIGKINNVPIEDKLSTRTINKYINWLRAFFTYCVARDLIKVNLALSIPTIKDTVNEQLQRLPLTHTEYKELLLLLPTPKRYLTQILAYTGMRLSELYKCKIEEIDGLQSFTLLDRTIKLKTKSSYRVIPIHDSLISELDMFNIFREQITPDNLAKTVSKIIKKEDFTDAHKKSLYSLRHSFATNLIQSGADSNIVSSLLGHSHKGNMTLSRYASGYSVIQLKKVVELL